MKTRKFFKRGIAALFAVVFTFCTLAPTVKVQAVEKSPLLVVEVRYITANGVRLYKEADPSSTVIALMYRGDQINYYPDITGAEPYSYLVYMTRDIAPRAGYVNSSYTTRSLGK